MYHRPRALSSVTLALLTLGSSACATLKPPALFVEKISVDRIAITGAGLNVGFRLRNPNPEAMLVERFEYDLSLNGHRLGRGYYADPIDLPGFKEDRVLSRFDLNFLSLPGAVKAILDNDRGRARVSGTFFVRADGGSKKLRFDSEAEVDLGRDRERR